MSVAYDVCLALIILSLLMYDVFGDETQRCTLHGNEKSPLKQRLLDRLAPLQGQKFYSPQGQSYPYAVTICGDASKHHPNGSITEEKPGENVTVLGRRNDSDILAGDSWLLLAYGLGDRYDNKSDCIGLRKSLILIQCKPEAEEPALKFLEHNKVWKDSCYYMFELQTNTVCPKTQKGLSNGSVFSIVFLTTLGLYFIFGILYKRMAMGAKGMEQIPHNSFWRELGNLQADGCNLLCRRDSSREDSWRGLTRNFSDSQDDHDRDDALLRP